MRRLLAGAGKPSVSEERADIVKQADSVSELSHRTAVLNSVEGIGRRPAVVIVAVIVVAAVAVIVIAAVVAVVVSAVVPAAQALRGPSVAAHGNPVLPLSAYPDVAAAILIIAEPPAAGASPDIAVPAAAVSYLEAL